MPAPLVVLGGSLTDQTTHPTLWPTLIATMQYPQATLLLLFFLLLLLFLLFLLVWCADRQQLQGIA